MTKYIFLDNWVLSKLHNDEYAHTLSSLITKNQYTILVTSSLIAELYNPKWEEAGELDRGLQAAKFFSNYPCVIVDPIKVFEEEYKFFPDNLSSLPVALDLKVMTPELRLMSILGLLRRDQIFLDQGKAAAKWQEGINKHKKIWLLTVKDIIENAKRAGYLEEDNFHNLKSTKGNLEVFLLSLDLRLVSNYDSEDFSKKLAEIKRRGIRLPKMIGARTTSLCFYYAYVDIDPTNRIRNKGSDIVDIYHFGLLPYSAAFTVDNDMQKVLKRVTKEMDMNRCSIITPNMTATNP